MNLWLFCFMLTIVNCLEIDSFEVDWSQVVLSSGNMSKYWGNPVNRGSYGVLKDSTDLSAFRSGLGKFIKEHNSDRDHDYETETAVKSYFWGKTNGIVLELGAVNGIYLSQSLPMEKILGWHRILIDGDPNSWPVLSTNIESHAFATAICGTPQMVHYVSDGAVSGIVEFMMPHTLKNWGDLFEKPKSEWVLYRNGHIHVTQLHCLPLQRILDHINVTHVNLFVLDVEGGELAVLKAIDFKKVRFDVLSVETMPGSNQRPNGYAGNVTAFLAKHGYKLSQIKGRNTWYTREDFNPTVIPKHETLNETTVKAGASTSRASVAVKKPSSALKKQLSKPITSTSRVQSKVPAIKAKTTIVPGTPEAEPKTGEVSGAPKPALVTNKASPKLVVAKKAAAANVPIRSRISPPKTVKS